LPSDLSSWRRRKKSNQALADVLRSSPLRPSGRQREKKKGDRRAILSRSIGEGERGGGKKRERKSAGASYSQAWRLTSDPLFVRRKKRRREGEMIITLIPFGHGGGKGRGSRGTRERVGGGAVATRSLVSLSSF